jgi:hypothetical protein
MQPKSVKPNTELAVAMSRFDFMKQFLMFAALGAASGGSAASR